MFAKSLSAWSSVSLETHKFSDDLFLSMLRILARLGCRSSSLNNFRNQGRGALHMRVAAGENYVSRLNIWVTAAVPIGTIWKQYSNIDRIRVVYMLRQRAGPNFLELKPML